MQDESQAHDASTPPLGSASSPLHDHLLVDVLRVVEEGVHHQNGARTQHLGARAAELAAAAWHSLLITILSSSCCWKLFQQLAGASVGGTERKDKGDDPTSVLGPSMVARCSTTARIFLKARSVLFQQIHQFNEASEGMRVVSHLNRRSLNIFTWQLC